MSSTLNTRLIWIDLEMTGLDTDNDQIIEIATIITDDHLNVLAEGPVLAIHQPDRILNAMDEWNTRQSTVVCEREPDVGIRSQFAVHDV